MGTRNLTKVIKDGEIVVAQYGQWDGYPSGQGLTVLNFLRRPEMIGKLITGLANCYQPSEDDLKVLSKPYLNERGMMFIEDGDKFTNDYPSLSRDTCAGILEVIATAKGKVPLFLDVEFENDEDMCEGVYTINLDTYTFTTKWDGELELSFDECLEISDVDYVTKAKCHVYEYRQTA